MATPGGLFDPILVNASWFEDGQQTAAEWFDPSLAATPMALATPLGLALPWLFTTTPLRPRKTAPDRKSVV